MPATNVIIGPNRKYAFALKDSRSRQFTLYTRLVDQMLTHEVATAINGPTAQAHALPSYTLHGIEFYWEFDQPNAIAYVVSLRESVLQASRDVIEDTYPFSCQYFA